MYHAKIDAVDFWFDINKVEQVEYSILYNNRSTNMEMIEGDVSNQYTVNTLHHQFNIEIMDARAKYAAMQEDIHEGENIVYSPMPGKVIKVLVQKGQEVKKGDNLIVVSAMKMESEYKSPIDGIIKKINVQAEDTVEANQPLIEIEDLKN